MNTIGFSYNETPVNTDSENLRLETEAPSEVSESPVRSLVEVRFLSNGNHYKYYNDRYALRPGDYVYVSGTQSGELGIVTDVNTRFKIHVSDYEKVLVRTEIHIHGRYESKDNLMISKDSEATGAEEIRAWLNSTQDDSTEEFVLGDGYSFALDEIEESNDFNIDVARRAVDYVEKGNVLYLSLNNGIGTAFVRGTKIYELNFRFDGVMVSDFYCTCPFNGLCKHSLGVMLILRRVLHHLGDCSNFVAFNSEFFWDTYRLTADVVKT